MIPALLLDMDGVLVDSTHVHLKAWQALFAPFGVAFSARRFQAEALGVSRDTVIRRVLGDGADLPVLMARKAALVHEILASEGCPTIAGARTFLEQARRRKMDVCLATSSRMPAPFLDAAGLTDLVPMRVDRTDVARGKPAPDVFLEAARRLGRAPSACVVVEDSPAGVHAGNTAGCRVVAITTNHQPETLRGADRVVSRLEEVWAFIGEAG